MLSVTQIEARSLKMIFDLNVLILSVDLVVGMPFYGSVFSEIIQIILVHVSDRGLSGAFRVLLTTVPRLAVSRVTVFFNSLCIFCSI